MYDTPYLAAVWFWRFDILLFENIGGFVLLHSNYSFTAKNNTTDTDFYLS